jgi:hypothetical protein
MKRLSRSLSKSYPPVVIHLNDLEELEKLLTDEGCEVKFETVDASYDSVAELNQHVQTFRIKELEIEARKPYLTIQLHQMWARLYVSADTTAHLGVFHKADEFFKRHLLWPPYLYSGPIWWAAWIIYEVSVTFHKFPFVFRTCVLSAFGIWGVWLTYVRFTRHSLVLRERAPQQPFWFRNRDALRLAMVSGLMGAILGIGGTLISTRLSTVIKLSSPAPTNSPAANSNSWPVVDQASNHMVK